MTAITFATPHSNLRPVNVHADLDQIADLIEICFGDQMDPDGREYIRHLRRAARDSGYLRWIRGAHERVSLPLHGYVWVEGRRIIGNLTLIPFMVGWSWYYLIANVAVHPDFRRRGIGRALTVRALEHIREHGASNAWLQVRDDNPSAIELYRSLGMVEMARRTTWQSISTPPQAVMNTEILVRYRAAHDWPQQKEWLLRTYPPEVAWNLPIEPAAYNPSFARQVWNFLNNQEYRHWSAEDRQGRLQGVITWQPSRHYADNIWLALRDDAAPMAITALLGHVRNNFFGRRPLLLNLPAGLDEIPFWEAGFEQHNTLIWMEMPFTRTKSKSILDLSASGNLEKK